MKKLRVKVYYKVVFPRSWSRKLPKRPRAVCVDLDEESDLMYMFNNYLTDPKVKLYLCYHDGTQRRIKLGRFKKNRGGF